MSLPSQYLKTSLTTDELVRCSEIGVLRQSEAKRKGLKSKRICPNYTDGEIHDIGPPYEMAYKKICGYAGDLLVNTFKSCGDVAGIEIRGRTKHWYDLNIRPDDNLDRIFVLVTSEDWWSPDNEFIIKGWLRGSFAATLVPLSDKGDYKAPAWFVPAIKLHPVPPGGIPQEWL